MARFFDRKQLRGNAKRIAIIVSWGMRISQYETDYVRFLANPEPFLFIPMAAKNIARRELRRRKSL
jgi:hypothetical protein